jgi:thiamine biosynthesis lipoprotein
MKLIQRVIFFGVLSLLFFSCDRTSDKKKTISGYSFGTSFLIQFEGKNNNEIILKKKIDSIFKIINNSFSTYISDSDISKINLGDSLIVVDDHFKKVFLRSYDIWKLSKGYFDPTVGSMVNAYGFGPGNKIKNISKKQLDSLIELTGFSKVSLTSKGTIKKKLSNIYLDFNAIGKGYIVDVISELLISYDTKNFLIEIGGEIIAKGKNPNTGNFWKVAIDNPNQKKNRQFIKTVLLKNKALATSGNYRKYRFDSLTGNKYVHTINPKNGKSFQSKILSVSVIASDCMTADAWATALMIMPIELSKSVIESIEDVDAYWILSNKTGFDEIFSSNWPDS